MSIPPLEGFVFAADYYSEGGAQPLKVDIRSNPISEEDTVAQNAAFSSVANVLRAVGLPTLVSVLW